MRLPATADDSTRRRARLDRQIGPAGRMSRTPKRRRHGSCALRTPSSENANRQPAARRRRLPTYTRDHSPASALRVPAGASRRAQPCLVCTSYRPPNVFLLQLMNASGLELWSRASRSARLNASSTTGLGCVERLAHRQGTSARRKGTLSSNVTSANTSARCLRTRRRSRTTLTSSHAGFGIDLTRQPYHRARRPSPRARVGPQYDDLRRHVSRYPGVAQC